MIPEKPQPTSSESPPLPEFDKQKYSDPEYLCSCRYAANRILLGAIRNSSQLEINATIAWIKQMGAENEGRHHGILFDEEVRLILEHKLVYPRPWSSARCQIEIPEKYDSTVGLFDASILFWAEQGYNVGIGSGVCDIYHAGYSLFFS